MTQSISGKNDHNHRFNRHNYLLWSISINIETNENI